MSDYFELEKERKFCFPCQNGKLPPIVFRDFGYDWPQNEKEECTVVTPQKNIIYLDSSVDVKDFQLKKSDIYIVQDGESLSSIAKKLGIKLEILIQHNTQLNDPDEIYPGNEIKIPEMKVEPQVILRDADQTEAKQVPYKNVKIERGKQIHLITACEQPMSLCCEGNNLPLNLFGTHPYTLRSTQFNNPTRWFLTGDYNAPVPFIKGNPSFQSFMDAPAEMETLLIPYEDEQDRELAAMVVANAKRKTSPYDKIPDGILVRQTKDWLAGTAIGTTITIVKEMLSMRIQRASNGIRYVIFLGRASLREIFTGTRYSLNKIYKYLVKGIWSQIKSTNISSFKGIKGATYIDIGIVVFTELKDYFSKPEDQKDLSDTLVAIATGTAKVVVGYLAISILLPVFLPLLGVTTAGFGLFIIGAAAMIGVGSVLEFADNYFGGTTSLQKTFNR